MIKDKYFRERGKTAKIIDVSCANCGSLLFVYQKDGQGWLKRCYLNRIISPDKYSNLKNNKNIKKESDLINLICKCGTVVGSPITYKDGRLAFHLIRGNFKRTNNKNNL
ncbi:MAG: hypothetical protein AABX66_01485 [Nanoarchaeota archaeon]